MSRALTAVALLIPLTALVFAAPRWGIVAVASLVGVLGYLEFRSLVRPVEAVPPLLPGLVAGLALVCAPDPMWWWLPVLLMVVLAQNLLTAPPGRVFPPASALVAGVIYCFAPWRSAVEVHAAGPHWLFAALGVGWAGDMAAYVVGKAIGRHKLAPAISPGKTWEGAIASVLAGSAFGAGIIGWFEPGTPAAILAVCAVANAFGQIGDLCESALKRAAGVKDSGVLLGSHGGCLDRVDSLLFTVPVFHAWLRLSH